MHDEDRSEVEEIGDNEPLVSRIVVPELSPIEIDLWIVTHNELRTNRRFRRVFDFLVFEFSDYDAESPGD